MKVRCNNGLVEARSRGIEAGIRNTWDPESATQRRG